MTLPDLPDEILLEIKQRCGDDDYRFLTPFVVAGKRSNRLVYSSEILRTCNLTALCVEPLDFIPGMRRLRGRPFFERCLREGNIQAAYFEALRLIIHCGDFEGGLNLMEPNIPDDGKSTLASALFYCLLGDTDEAGYLFQCFDAKHDHLVSDKARRIGQEIVREVGSFHPPFGGYFSYSFLFPPALMPECAYDHDPVHDPVCHTCFLYWVAHRVCAQL
ncbi:unnamed protein product [Microthlaspi erraticum]|uniref:Uncharacterized protein n=1 Tax=Microthlaspi erraticum TaxID=1685480 RepID=A0A6D2I026_9BRAS|nr:unnamed protein product [Microthlaspi erraticum]